MHLATQRAGIVIVFIHAALTSINLWLLLGQFRAGAAGSDGEAVTRGFAAYARHVGWSEALALAAAALAVALTVSVRVRTRALPLLLVSYVPVALTSAAMLVALLTGWQLDVVVLSPVAASPADLAATVRDATPVLLEPVLAGRRAAAMAGAVLFAVLLRRSTGESLPRAITAAAIAGAAMTLVLR